MIILLVVLIVLELLTFLVLMEHYFYTSKAKFFVSFIINSVLSIWLWILFIKATTYEGYFDTPENIRIRMNLTGMIFAVIIPRFIVILLHNTGRLFRLKKKGHSRGLTETGLVISALIFTVIALSTLFGRFNFKTEEVTVKIKGLDPRLEGLKIVQLSDMHLASFNHHDRQLEKVIDRVNSYKPDLIINTGDFISYGWREFDRCDTILSKSKSRYGNLTILGNHDMGTYFPNSSETDRDSNVMKMKELIAASGYRLLDNEHIIMDIRGVKVSFIGVRTSGRYPGIVHTDIRPAIAGSDTADFQILLIHDPNQWKEDVTDKTDIKLSFAGHTHGMQIGIITKNFRWSPSKYFYPEWNGLFSDGDQYLYVNRGLGVLSIPFRIWMPPEITVIILSEG
ncbi:MAG: metallophosphoesterase [Bacteroidia bacterium]|nr:metallophosphoesterase [Bacteroidia bacterium]